MRTKKWKDISDSVLNAMSVQELFVPGEDYRISTYEYPAGTQFPGQMRAGVCFVLSGSCRYDFKNQHVLLSAGDVIDFPSGSYSLNVLGNDKLVIVLVWKISELGSERH